MRGRCLNVIDLLIIEDNARLRPALVEGFTATAAVRITAACESGEAALEACLAEQPQVILMDVQLAGRMNGIEAAVAIRREFPRMPVIFYSIQDDDAYYRDFLQASILTHSAYVRKSNYLLPSMLVPLLRDAVAGRSFIDPEIASRVQEVRHRDRHDPMALLEPNEQQVARLLAHGLTNEQIAARMGFRDKRTISRVAGQIYAAWDLNRTATDEKIARTRAVIIALSGRLIRWDDDDGAYVLDERDEWAPWDGASRTCAA
jgi:DNA-binding NarL/FixJ family response regulator